MDYQVIWLDDAINDLRGAVEYIVPHNPRAAKCTGETILNKVKVLGHFPRIGKVFARLGRDGVREIPVPPYRVIHLVQAAAQLVLILTVWHGARREPDIPPGL